MSKVSEEQLHNVTAEDHERITAMIRKVEKKTSGEVYAVVAHQSDDYLFVAGFMAAFWALFVWCYISGSFHGVRLENRSTSPSGGANRKLCGIHVVVQIYPLLASALCSSVNRIPPCIAKRRTAILGPWNTYDSRP